MKRFVALCLMAVALATAPAFSADLQKGYDAFDNGDYKTAFSELRPFAEDGNYLVQYALGWMYHNGEGVPQDYKQALKWFILSAEQGFAGAQSELGYMYDKGQGVLQDYGRAHMWYNIGASNGEEVAAKNRDNVAKKMTPAQIGKAQNLAQECFAKDYKGC